MLFHVFFVFYANWLPDARSFGLIFDGTFAVEAFFVLSGISLSIAFLRAVDGGEDHAENLIRRMAAARYFRLAIPSLAASIIMYIVMRCGWNLYGQLPASMRSGWWTFAYTQENIRVLEVIKFALYSFSSLARLYQ
jgi:peptidoglycan/LPS O-acetylase OafA/YrhL